MASVADILSRLGQLHAHGFLTDEEFTDQKDAFLSASNADKLTPEDMEVADGELGELEKLAELCRANVLTREEFALQKRSILQTGTSNVVRDRFPLRSRRRRVIWTLPTPLGEGVAALGYGHSSVASRGDASGWRGMVRVSRDERYRDGAGLTFHRSQFESDTSLSV
jgi:hypothetical protein